MTHADPGRSHLGQETPLLCAEPDRLQDVTFPGEPRGVRVPALPSQARPGVFEDEVPLISKDPSLFNGGPRISLGERRSDCVEFILSLRRHPSAVSSRECV